MLGLLVVPRACPRCHRRRNPAQFLPEIDVYYSINPLVRASFQAKQTREGGDPTQAEIGPSIEFYLKPWIKLHNATIFDLDEAKKRALVFTTGYRVLVSPGAATTNRWELVATANFPSSRGLPALRQEPSRPGLAKRKVPVALPKQALAGEGPSSSAHTIPGSISATKSFMRASIRSGAPPRSMPAAPFL